MCQEDSGVRTRYPLSRILRDERGSVTAEFAVVLPIVLVVLALVVGGIAISAHRIALTSAAAEVARLEARGEALGAEERLSQLGGAVAVERSSEGHLHCVSLRDRPGSGLLARISVESRACAATSDIGATQ